eukprot:8299400-Alexandrium_andersonii.AAC.1
MSASLVGSEMCIRDRLRHDNDHEVRHLMDTAGWVSAEVVHRTNSMARFALSEDDLRVLIELENDPKV